MSRDRNGFNDDDDDDELFVAATDVLSVVQGACDANHSRRVSESAPATSTPARGRVRRPDRRGMLRELDRLLNVMPTVERQLEGLQTAFLAIGKRPFVLWHHIKDELVELLEAQQAATGRYPLHAAAAGHTIRLAVSQSEIRPWNPDGYERALQQLLLPASVDLTSRTRTVNDVVKPILDQIDVHVLPEWAFMDSEELNAVLKWRSELSTAFSRALSVLGLTTRLQVLEKNLADQVITFETRWVAYLPSVA